MRHTQSDGSPRQLPGHFRIIPSPSLRYRLRVVPLYHPSCRQFLASASVAVNYYLQEPHGQYQYASFSAIRTSMLWPTSIQLRNPFGISSSACEQQCLFDANKRPLTSKIMRRFCSSVIYRCHRSDRTHTHSQPEFQRQDIARRRHD